VRGVPRTRMPLVRVILHFRRGRHANRRRPSPPAGHVHRRLRMSPRQAPTNPVLDELDLRDRPLSAAARRWQPIRVILAWPGSRKP
jgi:hypothetical protein